jgi:hypothetical protein
MVAHEIKSAAHVTMQFDKENVADAERVVKEKLLMSKDFQFIRIKPVFVDVEYDAIKTTFDSFRRFASKNQRIFLSEPDIKNTRIVQSTRFQTDGEATEFAQTDVKGKFYIWSKKAGMEIEGAERTDYDKFIDKHIQAATEQQVDADDLLSSPTFISP